MCVVAATSYPASSRHLAFALAETTFATRDLWVGLWVGLDTGAAELTVQTVLSRLVTGEFGSPTNSLRTAYVLVEPYLWAMAGSSKLSIPLRVGLPNQCFVRERSTAARAYLEGVRR
eukprot:697801-Prorocentrum_minimum.AAC.1